MQFIPGALDPCLRNTCGVIHRVAEGVCNRDAHIADDLSLVAGYRVHTALWGLRCRWRIVDLGGYENGVIDPAGNAALLRTLIEPLVERCAIRLGTHAPVCRQREYHNDR